MSTIPMYETREGEAADASHRVTAPGGYEWWYFDVQDPANQVRLVAAYYHGNPFHPRYLRAYRRFARWPTRRHPPIPDDFLCAYFAIYEKGKRLARFYHQYPLGAFSASEERADLTMGPNRFAQQPDGSVHLRLYGIPWKYRLFRPKLLESQLLRGDLYFRPRAQALTRTTVLPRELTGGEHHWIVSNALCDVEGTVHIDFPRLNTFRPIEIRGSGYRDHQLGTSPLALEVRRWMHGRALFDDGSAAAWQAAWPDGDGLGEQVRLVEINRDGAREVSVERIEEDFSQRTRLWVRYPSQLKIGGVLLTHPRVIDSSIFEATIAYDAEEHGRKGDALCQVMQPNRLIWPLIGRRVQRSIFLS